ncbi:hypothetical protein FF125_01710 [Aureibaculum algae]|uniref:Uncharacterized protein n=1 Tax=Aureibaculum algae TaxID=2584122 RepID=A0A5B7TQL5_9FLAO|nr:hypothetical protein [Aureibaculum algae]QCX37217.1 hypothetical protein FF125_01710 [Aureibaculum algae]
MTRKFNYLAYLALALILLQQTSVLAQKIDNYKYTNQYDLIENTVKNENNFNGYTNYWHNNYNNVYRYGNLYKMEIPDIEKTILQSKVDIAEDFGIPGLVMQEGFINNLISDEYITLNEPSLKNLEEALEKNINVIVFVNPNSDVGEKVMAKLPKTNNWTNELTSHQFNAIDFVKINAFYLELNQTKLFVVSSKDKTTRNKFKTQIDNTEKVIKKYDFHKGWFGAFTLLNSVTITKGHPIEVIGTGMNEGNSWFVFDGYMDFLSKDEIAKWVKKVDLPIITDVGASNVFGAKDYEGFQIQQMYDAESWVKFAKEKEGYVFRQVYDTLADPYKYDGYFANEGNKEQIDNENVPFVLKTGALDKGALSSMVLFIEKGEKLSQKSLWNAILDRREVGVLEQGKMIGPATYRNALQMLVLDRIFLENYFGDPVNIVAEVKGYNLQVTITNTAKVPLSGTLEIALPPEIKIKGKSSVQINLDSKSSKTQYFNLEPEATATNNTNPIAVHYKYNGKKKSTLTMLDLPPAISVHRLLYSHAPKVSYPVTIHNFTNKSSFPVNIEVVNIKNERKVVFKTSQICNATMGTFKDLLFDLKLRAGNYKVKVSALGLNYTSQLGVGKAKGKPTLSEIDLNNDGVNEYRMENDSVQVTLLATGARVIEYIIKSRNDNILFKLWPEKAIDDKRSFRKRGYYPYGGFEDFLGQGSMETHQVYNSEIIKKEGDYVQVRMWTDYFGNRLEKTFTLYGNSPLLEIRFALTFINPEANMLGPQPILELGKKHWTEDVFMVPEFDGINEYRMKPEKYYGQAFDVKEGWNAGYDTEEDITFVGAFPVDQPLFLHMWMNHPRNRDAHHYYTEFQPWLPIFQKSTMYFSYYIWGAGGPWENGVQSLRDLNLISTRKTKL